MSAMAQPDRKGGGGLSLRTLAIASAASLVAAMVTSRLFPPGTVYTAALTPVLVAAVSEMLNRPVDRVAQIRQQRRTLVMEPARVPTFTPDEPETADVAAPEPSFEGANGDAPVRMYGRRSRILHPKVWIATGLAAFAIAAAVLTLPELIFGGSVATSHRTTLFGGGSSSSNKTKTQTQTQTSTTPTQTVTQTTTTTTPTQSQTSTTLTSTTPTTTQPAPAQTTPSDTTTSTSTTPSGAAVP
jgi:hypothetical protein